jgi:LemA protein
MLFLIFIGIIAVLVFWFIGIYNNLVKLRNMFKEAWSGVDVQLKRRYDLIPNLVETIKGYAGHEKSTLEEVIKLRNQCVVANSPGEQSKAENALTLGLRSLFAVAEAYPDLKANQNFQELENNLNIIEDEIQMSRRYFNGCVRNYNTAIETFATTMSAKSHR